MFECNLNLLIEKDAKKNSKKTPLTQRARLSVTVCTVSLICIMANMAAFVSHRIEVILFA